MSPFKLELKLQIKTQVGFATVILIMMAIKICWFWVIVNPIASTKIREMELLSISPKVAG
jgi:hypothetical protein